MRISDWSSDVCSSDLIPLRDPCPRIVSGPERLESGWWDGDDARREYYVIETSQGQRAWAVAPVGEQGSWMLHGWLERTFPKASLSIPRAPAPPALPACPNHRAARPTTNPPPTRRPTPKARHDHGYGR